MEINFKMEIENEIDEIHLNRMNLIINKLKNLTEKLLLIHKVINFNIFYNFNRIMEIMKKLMKLNKK